MNYREEIETALGRDKTEYGRVWRDDRRHDPIDHQPHLEAAKRHTRKEASRDDAETEKAVDQENERLCQEKLPEPDNSRRDSKKGRRSKRSKTYMKGEAV